MNVSTLTESLEKNSNENKEKVDDTLEKQKSLLLNIKNFNFKLRNFMETDVMQKNMIRESQEKINNVKMRIENSRLFANSIREKMERIKVKITDLNN
jgi:hypothetical protein